MIQFYIFVYIGKVTWWKQGPHNRSHSSTTVLRFAATARKIDRLRPACIVLSLMRIATFKKKRPSLVWQLRWGEVDYAAELGV